MRTKFIEIAANWALALTFAFVLLKLVGAVSLSWWWLPAPLLAGLACVFFVAPLLPRGPLRSNRGGANDRG